MAGRILVIAGTDLRRRIRNRSAVVTAFIGPLALGLIFSVLVSGASDATFTIAVVDADRSEMSTQVASGMTGGNGQVTFRSIADTDTARAAVDDGSVNGAVVFPVGFGAAVTSGSPAHLTVLRDPSRDISGQVTAAVAEQIAARFALTQEAVSAAQRLATPPGSADTAAIMATLDGVDQGRESFRFTDVPSGDRTLDSTAFYGASMSILFLFFTVSFGARSLLAERRDGTLARIFSTATPAWMVVAGKTISVEVLALAGMVTVWAVTSVGFDADWGSVSAVIMLMIATVLAIGGVSTVVAGWSRTEQQADSLTSIVTFVLALLGGNFVGPGAAPSLLAKIALFTPNGWAIKGFTTLSADTSGVTDIIRPLVVLAAITVVAWTIGLLGVRRMLR